MTAHSPELLKAAALALEKMAGQAEALGAVLCSDPDVVERHLTSLQVIDQISQHLDQIAHVMAADDPHAAIASVSLSDLKDHLRTAA